MNNEFLWMFPNFYDVIFEYECARFGRNNKMYVTAPKKSFRFHSSVMNCPVKETFPKKNYALRLKEATKIFEKEEWSVKLNGQGTDLYLDNIRVFPSIPKNTFVPQPGKPTINLIQFHEKNRKINERAACFYSLDAPGNVYPFECIEEFIKTEELRRRLSK